jgi:MFS family permease
VGAPAERRRFAGITRNVAALGVVSLLTDVSSEMIVPVLPLFVTGVLGASVTSLGVISGIAECTASALRVVSGWLSDRIGRRMPFLVLGYGLSGAAKAALALAGSWTAVLGLRFADRVGKGLRNPPRDALIADSTDPASRGAAFGLHRGLDTLGAAIGPLVAWALLQGGPAAGADYRRIFALSAIPAALSIAVLVAFVRAPRRARDMTPEIGRTAPAGGMVEVAAGAGAERAAAIATAAGAPDVSLAPAGAPRGAFRRFLVVDGLFQLGNSGAAFALLRAGELGLSPARLTLVYFAYNLVYALLAYPLGGLSDRIGRRPLLLLGYALYAGVCAAFAAADRAAVAVGAFVLLGVHSALIEGQQRSLIADLVPAERRGTAFGTYHAVVGAMLLPAGIAAGALWDRFGAPATFAAGAGCAAAATAGLWWLLPARVGSR